MLFHLFLFIKKWEHHHISLPLPIIMHSLNKKPFHLFTWSLMSSYFPPSSSFGLSELPVHFSQFVPEEQWQNGMWSKSEIRGSQTFVESQQALLPQRLWKAVKKPFVKLPLKHQKMQVSSDLISKTSHFVAQKLKAHKISFGNLYKPTNSVSSNLFSPDSPKSDLGNVA